MDSSTKSGNIWEIIAIKYLLNEWYRIIETNFKIKWWEIDIVSEFGSNIIFFEVKYRRNDLYWTPEEALNKTKRKNILRTIKYYMMKNKIREDTVRFEFIGITETNWEVKLNHFKDIEL